MDVPSDLGPAGRRALCSHPFPTMTQRTDPDVPATNGGLAPPARGDTSLPWTSVPSGSQQDPGRRAGRTGRTGRVGQERGGGRVGAGWTERAGPGRRKEGGDGRARSEGGGGADREGRGGAEGGVGSRAVLWRVDRDGGWFQYSRSEAKDGSVPGSSFPSLLDRVQGPCPTD